jgi:hypothetical protein
MPTILNCCALNYAEAEVEYEFLTEWFEGRNEFSEREFISHFKSLRHLALMMSLIGEPRHPDRYKHEFEIQGVFRADLVVGSGRANSFTFVEFEGAQRNSLFGPKATNQMRNWGAQLQSGIGQIFDWSWAINDAQASSVFENSIGCRDFRKTFLLICGLNKFVDNIEERRLFWLNNNFQLSGNRALFMTYDDLMDFFSSQLDGYRDDVQRR